MASLVPAGHLLASVVFGYLPAYGLSELPVPVACGGGGTWCPSGQGKAADAPRDRALAEIIARKRWSGQEGAYQLSGPRLCSGERIAAGPSPRRTLERVGATAAQGSSLSNATRASRSPGASGLPNWTPALPHPRSAHAHSGTRARRRSPSPASITATPSAS